MADKIPTLGANTSPSLTLEAGDYTVEAPIRQPFVCTGFSTRRSTARPNRALTIMAGGRRTSHWSVRKTNAGVKINYSTISRRSTPPTPPGHCAQYRHARLFGQSDAGRTGYFPYRARGFDRHRRRQGSVRRRDPTESPQALSTITVKDANVRLVTFRAMRTSRSGRLHRRDQRKMSRSPSPENGGNTGGDGGNLRQTIYGENIGSTDVTSSRRWC
ncbi:MAG: hypothetical protein ACLR8Y_08705 [Alistipes indistinctus]